MGVVMAPILGPVLGGWVTDHLTWRWIFYINLPVGVLAVLLILFLIQDPSYIRRKLFRIDRWGLFFLTVGLGALQIVLDKGQRDDWFSARFILYSTVISASSLVAFVIVELRTSHPVVDLRAFRHRSFAAGCTIMFAGFLALFGTLVLLPLYVQDLMNYTALWAGLVLGPGGLASFLVMPVAGVLMRKGVNPRTLLALGLMIMAYSMWLMSAFNLYASFFSISWPRVVMGFGIGLFFVPLAAGTFVGISKEETGNASGIFNLLRNLGGSFGVAIGTTVFARRAQVHQNFLVENVTPYSFAFQSYYAQVRQWLESHDPSASFGQGPLAEVYREVLRQVSMLAFNDAFLLLGWITALLLPLTLLMKKPEGPTPLGMAY
jgi:DHA2 family multidrug resistance protein